MTKLTNENYREQVLGYFDRVAPAYGIKHGADMPGGRYSFGTLYKDILAVHLRPGMDVLELGCGNGASSEMLAGCGVRLTATDISEEMVKIAATRQLKNTTFRCLDAMNLPTAGGLGEYDVIIGFNAFSYFPDKSKVLRDLKKFLKPGGQLIFLDMNALCPLYPLMVLTGKNEMRSWWSTIRAMTPGNMRRLFGDAGYEVSEIRTLNFVPHGTQGIVFQFLKTINPVLNAIPLVNKLAMRIMVRAHPRVTT